MIETTKRIGVLYSKGPHLMRLLHFLRTTYPDAEIVLFIPENYPQKHVLPLVSKVQTFPESAGLSGRVKLLREVRNSNADIFAIMFPSVKLRTFAKLSGAKEQYVFSVVGEFLEVKVNLLQELLFLLLQRIRGFVNFWLIQSYIMRNRVGK
jgi:hypothetical protein